MRRFHKESENMKRGLAKQQTEPKPTEKIELLIEYFEQSTEKIQLTYNLEELQQLIGNSISTGASINFITKEPSFAINPRWIKKVTIKKLG